MAAFREELVASAGQGHPLVLEVRSELAPFRGFIASASVDVVLDPALGALGLSLGRHSFHVGEACLSLFTAPAVFSATSLSQSPAGHFAAFHPPVLWFHRTVTALPRCISLSPILGWRYVCCIQGSTIYV